MPNGETTLDALVYVPPGSPEPTYAWSWCASLGNTQQCATTSDELAAILNDAGAGADAGTVSVDYAIGSGDRVAFKYPVDSAFLEAACAATRGASADAGDAGDAVESDAGDAGNAGIAGLRCGAGTWTLYVMLTVTVGDRTLAATRNITAHLTTPSSMNRNPTITGLAPFTSKGARSHLAKSRQRRAKAGKRGQTERTPSSPQARPFIVVPSARRL